MDSKQEKLLRSRAAELEKQLAAKNRYLEIEASLERVRTVAMGMRVANDLLNICQVLFEEFKALGFGDLRNAMINILHDEEGYFLDYDFNDSGASVTPFLYNSHPMMERQVELTRSATDAFIEHSLTGDDLEDFKAFRVSNGEPPDPKLENISGLYYYFYSIGVGSVGISTFSSLNEEKLNVLKRFRNVFDLAYRRYTDIQLAEEQAKEARLETALERVRARTMAMQHSGELSETAFILFQQFKELGETPDQATIGIVNEEEGLIEYWVTMYGSQINKVFKFPIDEPNVTNRIYKAWKAQEKSLVIDLSGKELYDFTTFRASLGGAAFNPEEKRRVINVAFFSKGIINVQSSESRSAESIHLLERFAGVFEGTYTRFLDLKKAEAQAREAQIEAALEKVRSRSLAMHQTEELREVVSVVFNKLHDLGIVVGEEAASIVIFTEGTKDLILWNAIPDQLYSKSFHIPYYDTAVITSLLDAKSNGDDFFERNYTPEEKDHFWNWAVEYSDYKNIPDERKKRILDAGHFACSVAYTKNSAILVSSYQGKLLSEKEGEILKRFARVFEQAYVRFLDLHKAEAQAREAQVEAALERVRSKTMAMHTSSDVSDAVATLFGELLKLGVETTIRCGVAIINNDKRMEVWTASEEEGKTTLIKGFLDMTIHPLLQGIFNGWKNKEQNAAYELTGKDLIAYYEAIIDSPDYPYKPDMKSLPEKQINNAFFFPEGTLFAFTLEPLSAEATKLFTRFGGVFGLTYRRFLDLQKAEAQAREAQIEAGLERVRSRTLAMQKSDELAQTAVVVFKQLIDLGIQPNRLFIGIIHDDSGDIEFWATAEDGTKISNKFIGNAGRNKSITKMYQGWKKHKKSIIIDMRGKELQEYFNYLGNELKVPFTLGLSQKRRVQLITYFSQGFIGMASPDMQPVETTSLLERFAGVFNLTYTRFNDLKIAEAHAIQAEEDLIKLYTEKRRAEDALSELQATQKQLIQSEKMASLGELTAGIAHEIQNPLNFVNNFSEVNQEMIEELEEELRAGNIAEALALAADIKGNELKINHHGKRADGIVKGMLQHSRSGGGEKQPTNINALADEFFKLSYHGLRAKDKTFNAELITHFDPNLPQIKVIAQDIGRVLLNLFNNAFYAVNQRSKTAGGGYRPEVSVTTTSEDGQVFIKVKDNGIGMPEHIKEKIMQPFFTTKPTGEGTGLGLSLTYDMVVKGHGGSIIVDTKENEYTEFTVLLPLS